MSGRCPGSVRRLVSVCLLLVQGLWGQQDPAAEFAAARAEFAAGQVAAAQDRLWAVSRSLTDGMELERGFVEFHLGHCAMALGRPAEALLLYRRAALVIDHPEVNAAVTAAARRFLLHGEPGGAESLGGWVQRLPHSVGLLTFVVSLALVQGLALCLWLWRPRRMVKAVLVVIVLTTTVVTFQCVSSELSRPVHGIVLDRGADLRLAPDLPVSTRLRAGTEVRVLSLPDPFVQFVQIEHDGGIGFVDKAGIGVVGSFPKASPAIHR